MANKFGKFLLFTATATATAAAGYYLYQKKDKLLSKFFPSTKDLDADEDDFEAFESTNESETIVVDSMEKEEVERNYVPLSRETTSEDFSPLSEQIANSEEITKDTVDKTTTESSPETVEEFFDDEKTTEE